MVGAHMVPHSRQSCRHVREPHRHAYRRVHDRTAHDVAEAIRALALVGSGYADEFPTEPVLARLGDDADAAHERMDLTDARVDAIAWGGSIYALGVSLSGRSPLSTGAVYLQPDADTRRQPMLRNLILAGAPALALTAGTAHADSVTSMFSRNDLKVISQTCTTRAGDTMSEAVQDVDDAVAKHGDVVHWAVNGPSRIGTVRDTMSVMLTTDRDACLRVQQTLLDSGYTIRKP